MQQSEQPAKLPPPPGLPVEEAVNPTQQTPSSAMTQTPTSLQQTQPQLEELPLPTGKVQVEEDEERQPQQQQQPLYQDQQKPTPNEQQPDTVQQQTDESNPQEDVIQQEKMASEGKNKQAATTQQQNMPNTSGRQEENVGGVSKPTVQEQQKQQQQKQQQQKQQQQKQAPSQQFAHTGQQMGLPHGERNHSGVNGIVASGGQSNSQNTSSQTGVSASSQAYYQAMGQHVKYKGKYPFIRKGHKKPRPHHNGGVQSEKIITTTAPVSITPIQQTTVQHTEPPFTTSLPDAKSYTPTPGVRYGGVKGPLTRPAAGSLILPSSRVTENDDNKGKGQPQPGRPVQIYNGTLERNETAEATVQPTNRPTVPTMRHTFTRIPDFPVVLTTPKLPNGTTELGKEEEETEAPYEEGFARPGPEPTTSTTQSTTKSRKVLALVTKPTQAPTRMESTQHEHYERPQTNLVSSGSRITHPIQEKFSQSVHTSSKNASKLPSYGSKEAPTRPVSQTSGQSYPQTVQQSPTYSMTTSRLYLTTVGVNRVGTTGSQSSPGTTARQNRYGTTPGEPTQKESGNTPGEVMYEEQKENQTESGTNRPTFTENRVSTAGKTSHPTYQQRPTTNQEESNYTQHTSNGNVVTNGNGRYSTDSGRNRPTFTGSRVSTAGKTSHPTYQQRPTTNQEESNYTQDTSNGNDGKNGNGRYSTDSGRNRPTFTGSRVSTAGKTSHPTYQQRPTTNQEESNYTQDTSNGNVGTNGNGRYSTDSGRNRPTFTGSRVSTAGKTSHPTYQQRPTTNQEESNYTQDTSNGNVGTNGNGRYSTDSGRNRPTFTGSRVSTAGKTSHPTYQQRPTTNQEESNYTQDTSNGNDGTNGNGRYSTDSGRNRPTFTGSRVSTAGKTSHPTYQQRPTTNQEESNYTQDTSNGNDGTNGNGRYSTDSGRNRPTFTGSRVSTAGKTSHPTYQQRPTTNQEESNYTQDTSNGNDGTNGNGRYSTDSGRNRPTFTGSRVSTAGKTSHPTYQQRPTTNQEESNYTQDTSNGNVGTNGNGRYSTDSGRNRPTYSANAYPTIHQRPTTGRLAMNDSGEWNANQTSAAVMGTYPTAKQIGSQETSRVGPSDRFPSPTYKQSAETYQADTNRTQSSNASGTMPTGRYATTQQMAKEEDFGSMSSQKRPTEPMYNGTTRMRPTGRQSLTVEQTGQ